MWTRLVLGVIAWDGRFDLNRTDLGDLQHLNLQYSDQIVRATSIPDLHLSTQLHTVHLLDLKNHLNPQINSFSDTATDFSFLICPSWHTIPYSLLLRCVSFWSDGSGSSQGRRMALSNPSWRHDRKHSLSLDDIRPEIYLRHFRHNRQSRNLRRPSSTPITYFPNIRPADPMVAAKWCSGTHLMKELK